MPHEWCREHVMRHIAIIVPTYALRYVQTRTRSREGYVELACILSQEARVVATVEVGHTSVDSVEDDDVVELQTLRLVYCRDEDALVDATASAEVGFLQRTYLHGVVGELLVERRLRCGVNHILREISRDVAQAANRLYHVVGKERVVEALQLGNQCRGCTCLRSAFAACQSKNTSPTSPKPHRTGTSGFSFPPTASPHNRKYYAF